MHVTLDDVIGVDEDPMMRTAQLGMVSGRVDGVAVCRVDADRVQSATISLIAMRFSFTAVAAPGGAARPYDVIVDVKINDAGRAAIGLGP